MFNIDIDPSMWLEGIMDYLSTIADSVVWSGFDYKKRIKCAIFDTLKN